jgi:hypothetical protein
MNVQNNNDRRAFMGLLAGLFLGVAGGAATPLLDDLTKMFLTGNGIPPVALVHLAFFSLAYCIGGLALLDAWPDRQTIWAPLLVWGTLLFVFVMWIVAAGPAGYRLGG